MQNIRVYTQTAIKSVLDDNVINEMLISTVNGHVITSHHLPITGGRGEEPKASCRVEDDILL